MIKIEYLEEEVPVFDITVEGNRNFYANDILVHNCTEIVLASRPSEQISEELVTLEDGQKKITKDYTAGEIALCNLSSVNLERWFYLTDAEKTRLVKAVVRGLDNTVDVANYPVKEGKNSNMMYRYLGIGVLNYTNYLALNGITIDTQEAAEETDRLFEDLSYRIISASVDLAQEKGKFEKFYETEWAEGVLPIHKANKNADSLTAHQYDREKWEELSERVRKFGIRNAQLMAIAPTACQTLDSEIETDVGVEKLGSLVRRKGIDTKGIEGQGKIGWYDFDEPSMIPTRFGPKKSERVWYNGKVETRKITFEDGNTYEFSMNHKLLAKVDGKEEWVMVRDLVEGMEILEKG